MFDYSFWPEGFSSELNKQLENFHFQAQLQVSGEVFLEIANKILKAQVSGKYFELIVFLPKGYRTFENANLLHRIARAGAKVGVLEIPTIDQEAENFGIFDNKLIYSNKNLSENSDLPAFFLKKNREFTNLMSNSRPVTIPTEGLQIQLWADNYFVRKGGEITVFWEVKNAASVLMNPGRKPLQESGQQIISIEEDLLLTLEAKNEKNIIYSSLFIKCLEDEFLRLTVSVFDPDIDSFVEIESIFPGKSIYAVYQQDLVKIEWVCKSGSTLFEPSLGKLPNIGYHHFISVENEELNFEINFSDKLIEKQIVIYTTSKEDLFHQENINNSSADDTIKKKKAKLEEIQKYFLRFINFLLKFQSKK